jgi:protein-L-isoaspartate(D-aspartate) O-methyltransferase
MTAAGFLAFARNDTLVKGFLRHHTRVSFQGDHQLKGFMHMGRKTSFLLICLTGAFLAFCSGFGPRQAGAENRQEAEFLLQREKMVKEQISEAPDYRDPVKDPRVLSAMRTVPRHLFVERKFQASAYGDFPLPIGYGQTISQPYIVALMTEMLGVKADHKVLEVGAGSGYQAAILSLLVKEVFTIEIVAALALQAEERLKRLKYANVSVRVGDGYYGWEEVAPFDRIIVTCAASLVPPALLKQLKPGGKICIPVGAAYSVQYLTMVEKSETGAITMRKSIPVRFVPLTRSGKEE